MASSYHRYSEEEIRVSLTLLPRDDRRWAADGRACLDCGGQVGDMIPVGERDGVQMFSHISCVERREALRRKLGLSHGE
jgi:hypothetical protein